MEDTRAGQSRALKWFGWLALGAAFISVLGGLLIEAAVKRPAYEVVGGSNTDPVDIRHQVPDTGVTTERKIPILPLSDPPESVEMRLDDDLPQAIRVEIEGAVGMAHRYFLATGADGLPPSLIVIASSDAEALIDEVAARSGRDSPAASLDWWERYRGTHNDGVVYLRADWPVEPSGESYWVRSEIVELVLHELSHAVHHHLAGGSRAATPAWFTEGAAEVETFTALEAFGFDPFETALSEVEHAARSELSPLESSETFTGGAHTLGFLAVARLTSDGDLTPLRDVFARMTGGRPFAQAFEDAIGRSAHDFVNEFESYRAVHFPVYAGRIEGHVRVTGPPLGQLVAWACPVDYECQSGYVRSDGSFLLAVPDGRYTLQFGVDDDNAAWWVYFAQQGPVSDASQATSFPVFGTTVEGFDLTIPTEMLGGEDS